MRTIACSEGGFYGVDIFFVLSAFLITSLITEEVETRGGRYDFLGFYTRRALRLGPALALWLLVVAPVTAIAVHQSGEIPVASAAALFYFSDFAIASGIDLGTAYTHAWSLSIEEQFYFVWPWILVFVLGSRTASVHRKVLLASVPAAVLLSIVTAHAFASNYFLPTGHIVPIALGCLAANLFRRGLSIRVESALRHPALGLALLAALVIAITAYRPRFGYETGAVILLGVSGATAALILHVCIATRSAVMTALTTKPVLWLGRRSYGLYLYHRTLSILFPALLPGIPLRVGGPVVLALSSLLAETSFRYIERPINRRGRAWLHRRDSRTGEAEFTLPIAQPNPGPEPT